jgi:tRNA pseudouridine32 synthase/23S rRNA pseudouridine746 synthase/23S rRNA pseudouridine955/2504/2580 synthase
VTALRILHSDPSFVAVDKPPGMSVIPGRSEERGPPVREVLESQLGRPVWVVHRLDRNTSGILLFALDSSTHRSLSMAFEEGRVQKIYLALAKGRLEGERDARMALAPARRGRMRPVRPGEVGKEAQTRFRSLESLGDRATLVEARPITGRTHQIRVHLLALGHPLLFDHQYGQPRALTESDLGGATDEVVLDRTPLHASQLTLRGLSGVPDVEIISALPPDMERALMILRSATG